jgi:uncharacterized protein (DUF983 family)
MLHSDIVAEHSCDAELIPLSEAPTYIHVVRCSSCGTEFAFEPDSDWSMGIAMQHIVRLMYGEVVALDVAMPSQLRRTVPL